MHPKDQLRLTTARESFISAVANEEKAVDQVAILKKRVVEVRGATLSILQDRSEEADIQKRELALDLSEFIHYVQNYCLIPLIGNFGDETIRKRLIEYMDRKIRNTKKAAELNTLAEERRRGVDTLFAIFVFNQALYGKVVASDQGKADLTSLLAEQGFSVPADRLVGFAEEMAGYVLSYTEATTNQQLIQADEDQRQAKHAQELLGIIEPYRDVVVLILESDIDDEEKRVLLLELCFLIERDGDTGLTVYK